jgi:hypothetical protein
MTFMQLMSCRLDDFDSIKHSIAQRGTIEPERPKRASSTDHRHLRLVGDAWHSFGCSTHA